MDKYREVVLIAAARVDNPSAVAKDIADNYYNYLLQEINQ